MAARLARAHAPLLATPLGMAVAATDKPVEVDGRSLWFSVWCADDAGLLGEGMHYRAIVDVARCEQRLEARHAAATGASTQAG